MIAIRNHRACHHTYLVLLLACITALQLFIARASKDDTDESWSLSSLKHDDFQKNVMGSTDSWLIAYYDSSQKQTDVINEVFNGLAKKHSNLGIYLGTIDCAVEKKLCKSAGLRMMPTIQLVVGDPVVNPYSGKKYRTPQHFEGTSLDPRSLEKFISKGFPASLVTKISSERELNDFLKSNTADAQPPKAAPPVAILFTEKDTVTMLYKTISYHFRGRIKFLQVSIDKAPEIAEKFDITETTLALISSDTDDGKTKTKLIKYEGGNLKNRAAIITWLTPYDPSPTPAATAGSSEDSEEDDAGEDGSDASAAGAAAGTEDDVTKYSPSSLDLETVSSDYAYLLAVVGSSKTVSTDIPQWSKLVKGCEGRMKAALLECDGFQLPAAEGEEEGATKKYSKLGERACAQYATAAGSVTQARPYLLVIPHGTPARKRKLDPSLTSKWASGLQFSPDEYEKAKSALGDSIPDTGIRAIPEQMINQFFGENMQQQKNSIVFISRSHTLPVLFKNIALHHGEMAQYAFVVNPSEDMLASIGNPKLPAVFGIPAFDPEKDPEQLQGGLRVVSYDPISWGPLRFWSLSKFVRSLYGISKRAAGENVDEYESSASGSSSASAVSKKDLVLVNTEVDWNKHCGENFRGICAIGFFSSTELDKGAAAMKVAIESLGTGASAFKFLYVDAECQQEFAAGFDVEYHHLPVITAYSPSKKRYSSYKGTFSEVAIKDHLSSVVRGGTATIPLTHRPFITVSEEQCKEIAAYAAAALAGGAEAITEDSGDADDFLAEIRREEAERAAQLKKEVEEERKRLLEEEAANKKKKNSSSKKSGGKKKKKKSAPKKDEL